MKTKTKYKDGGKKTTTKKVLTAPKPSFAPKDPFFKQTTSKVGSDTKSTPVKGKPVSAKKKPAPTKPVVKKSAGPTVKSEWESKTGTPWKEAKERGLTDGSRSQNMRIMKDLKSGEDFKLGSKLRSDDGSGSYEKYKERTTKYKKYKTGGVKKSTTRKKK
jgi:hypothetical protein